MAEAAGRLAEEAADAFALRLTRPVMKKVMQLSNVTGGFWLQLPHGFSSFYKDASHEFIVKLEHDQKLWEAKYLPKGGSAGLSGGWRGFSIDKDLKEQDVILFEKASETRIKIWIFRVKDYQKGRGVAADKITIVPDAPEDAEVVRTCKLKSPEKPRAAPKRPEAPCSPKAKKLPAKKPKLDEPGPSTRPADTVLSEDSPAKTNKTEAKERPVRGAKDRAVAAMVMSAQTGGVSTWAENNLVARVKSPKAATEPTAQKEPKVAKAKTKAKQPMKRVVAVEAPDVAAKKMKAALSNKDRLDLVVNSSRYAVLGNMEGIFFNGCARIAWRQDPVYGLLPVPIGTF